jgi:hypothetical protein
MLNLLRLWPLCFGTSVSILNANWHPAWGDSGHFYRRIILVFDEDDRLGRNSVLAVLLDPRSDVIVKVRVVHDAHSQAVPGLLQVSSVYCIMMPIRVPVCQ